MSNVQPNMDSRVAMVLKDTVVNGDLCMKEGLRLFGQVRGNVQSEGRVEVMSGAVVGGKVRCDELYVEGKIEGEVKVRVLEVGNGAVLTGRVEVNRLRVRGMDYMLKWLRLVK